MKKFLVVEPGLTTFFTGQILGEDLVNAIEPFILEDIELTEYSEETHKELIKKDKETIKKMRESGFSVFHKEYGEYDIVYNQYKGLLSYS